MVDVLSPIWLSKAATAKKVREVLEAVFDYAGAKGKRSAPNPAVMKGNLDTLLPQRPTLTRGHHPAVPVAIAPALYARLVRSGGGYVRAETVTHDCNPQRADHAGAARGVRLRRHRPDVDHPGGA